MSKKFILVVTGCLLALSLSACSEARYVAHVAKQIPISSDQQSTGIYKVGNPYTIQGRRYYPKESYNYSETGVASWYGPKFHGKQTANGEIFDKYELTAAHKTLQLPSIIRVTNLANGRAVILRVNDRGPFSRDRVLDVSERAATLLGFKNNGTTRVRIDVMPQESKQVASLAKAGTDTRGYEVALNSKKQIDPENNMVLPPRRPVQTIQVASVNQAPQAEYRAGSLAPVQVQPLTPPLPPQKTISQTVSHMEPITSPSPISDVAYSNKIYVQAGAFSEEQNALSLSNSLSRIGPSKVYMTRVNDRPFFRVRLGPYADEAEAQKIATTLLQSGNTNTKLVMD